MAALQTGHRATGRHSGAGGRPSVKAASQLAALRTAAVKPPLDNACSCPAAGDTVELAHAQWGTSQEAGWPQPAAGHASS